VRWLALAALLAIGGVARADGDRALSLGLGYATFDVPGPASHNQTPPDLSPDAGGALSVSYEHALSTDLSLRGEAAGGLFDGGNVKKEGALSYAGLVDVGIAFRFDVLKYVPYAFAGVGGVVAGGGPIDVGAQPVLVIGGGLDWLQSRDRSYGVEGRLASFAGDVTVFTLGVRASVRWGYF
jgi:hypothetical protein